MIQDNYNILSEMLNTLKWEMSDLDAQIQCNLLFIREANDRVESIEKSYADEFQMFSPRTMSSFRKEELVKANLSKADYEETNRVLYEKKDVVEDKIKKLEKVLKQEGHNITALYVQEEDRQRIARDLHDTSLQNISYLVHKIELCSLYIEEDPRKARLELSEIGESLRETADEIRNIIFDLRPMIFDNLGLKASLERFLNKINSRGKYLIEAEIDDVPCENNLVLLYIYRIVQDSLNNIIKHADASRIKVLCKMRGDTCVIDIEDDGRGFYDGEDTKEDNHFGLSLMKERVALLNGDIDISSIRGCGTRIHMEIPIGKTD